jgi:hypothetical protein
MIGPFSSSPQLNKFSKLKPKAFSIASLIFGTEATVGGPVTNRGLEDRGSLAVMDEPGGARDGGEGESIVPGRDDTASCI